MSSALQFARRLTTRVTAARTLIHGWSNLNTPSFLLTHQHLISPTHKLSKFTSLNGVRLRSTSASKFEVINVQDADDFKKRVIDASSKVPIIVDFHATWCGPCKLLGPRLESIIAEEKGRVMMAKVDIDDHSELALEYGVRSVPTVMGMKNGKVQNQFVGLVDDDQIRTFVDKLAIS